MQCPVCDERMKEVERLGVSIDICPGCKGVWLDRGELDKLIAVSQQPGAVTGQASARPADAAPGVSFLGQDQRGPGQGRSDHHDDRDRHHEKDRGHGHDHGHDRDHDGGHYASNAHDRGHGQEHRRGSWFSNFLGGDD
jgi:uncharacterized protein